jgi:hypothetical protein
MAGFAMHAIEYDQDCYCCTRQQPQMPRQQRCSKVDINNVVEEIETFAHSQRREPVLRGRTLRAHRLTWRNAASFPG